MTDYDVIRWTALVYLTWRGCGIAWKLLASQAERVRVWYNEGERQREVEQAVSLVQLHNEAPFRTHSW